LTPFYNSLYLVIFDTLLQFSALMVITAAPAAPDNPKASS